MSTAKQALDRLSKVFQKICKPTWHNQSIETQNEPHLSLTQVVVIPQHCETVENATMCGLHPPPSYQHPAEPYRHSPICYLQRNRRRRCYCRRTSPKRSYTLVKLLRPRRKSGAGYRPFSAGNDNLGRQMDQMCMLLYHYTPLECLGGWKGQISFGELQKKL